MSKLLIDSYIYYENNYKNKFNIFTHIFCIPILIWSIITLFSYVPFEFTNINYENVLLKPLKINISFLISTFYIIYYTILYSKLFKLWLILFYLIFYTSNLYRILYPKNGLFYCLNLFIISITLPILSHKYIECNKKNIFVNIIQLFTVIPLLTIFRLLFNLNFKKKLFGKIQKAKIKRRIMQSYQIKMQL